MTDTEKLLRQISKHLSSREECRRVQYRVVIEKVSVTMYPNYCVFPDARHRRDSDKINLLDHILSMHLDSNIALTEGTYEYRLTFPQLRRRSWVNIR